MKSDFECSIDEAGALMKCMYLDAIKNDVTPQNAFLHGTYGIGKSSLIKQIKEYIEEETGKEVVLIDKRLSNETEATLLGMPYTSEVEGKNHKEMFYSTPTWFPEDPNKIYIVFLDEFSNGTKNVQQASYRLVLDREVTNGKKLDNNVIIIAAGNLKSDKTGVKPVLPAAGNRFACHFFINEKLCADGFIKHAIKNNFDEDIISYIAFDNDALNEESTGALSVARSRTWEEMSKHKKNPFFTESMREKVYRATIGNGSAAKFIGYLEFKKYLPDWNDVRSGKDLLEGNYEREAQYQLTIPLARETIKAIEEDNDQHLNNLCTAARNCLNNELLIVFARFLKSSPKSLVKVMKSDKVMELIKPVLDKV